MNTENLIAAAFMHMDKARGYLEAGNVTKAVEEIRKASAAIHTLECKVRKHK